MKKLVEGYCELPKTVRKPLWRLWHYLIQQLDKDAKGLFLNYGYESHNGFFKDFYLEPEDEPNRYGIQLYQYATRKKVLENSRVLEVGCGRGGGASWLAKYRRPKAYVGLDISKSAIDFCAKKYQINGLSFIQGEAENIPFDAGQFDAVVNIESARCYGSIKTFFKEVHRVLKAGGYFFFSDMIKQSDKTYIEQLLLAANFKTLQKENITSNIVLALQADSEARKTIIKRRVPAFLQQSFYEFAGVEGSNRFNTFYNNEIEYWNFILQKK